MITRRLFLKHLGASAVATSLVGTDVAESLWGQIKRWWSGCRCRKGYLCNKCKEKIIAQALETEEGRVALAQAMVEPIRRSLEYQAVARKIMLVDELPQGALATYERGLMKKWAA